MVLRKFLGAIPRLGLARPSEDLPDISSAAPRDRFFERAETLGPTAMVLEVGTKRADEAGFTHWFAAFPQVPRQNYVMADIAAGLDVDIVADLHRLPPDWSQRFDVFIASAVFEHLERPWIAAQEAARVLKSGGLCYVATHQTFPLHGYPSDFFRFSKEALELLFVDAGLRILDVAYEHRTRIIPPLAEMTRKTCETWNRDWPSYLCVHLLAEKP